MDNLKLAVYENILNISEKSNMDELIDKYEIALCRYCFDKNVAPILDINLLSLIVQSFEFYYMIINQKELEIFDLNDLRQYQFDHSEEIRIKTNDELTKCDMTYMYTTMLIEEYGKAVVNDNELFFIKFMSISKLLKDYEWIIEKKRQLS